jgi:hypothetical protein
LKGCYERNFNLFKQIYAFETAHGQAGVNTNLAGLSEADRLREYERRLQIARKAGSDVGNITARTIDHWHRVGWYDLFYRRYVICRFLFQPLTYLSQDGMEILRQHGPSKEELPVLITT